MKSVKDWGVRVSGGDPAWNPLHLVEVWSAVVFALEYITRLVVITEKTGFEDPIRGRIAFALSFEAVVDLLSFAPTFLEMLFESG